MRFLFFVLKTPTTLLALGIFLLSVILAVVSGRMQSRTHKTVFRLLCLIPLIACIIHIGVFFPIGHKYLASATLDGGVVRRVYLPKGFDLYGKLYLSAVMALLMMLTAGKGRLRRLLSVLLCGIIGYCAVMQVFRQFMDNTPHNETHLGWTEAFDRTVDIMQEEYVLSEWKDIDYDALRAEIRPLIEAAEADGDLAAYGAALCRYTYRFNDSHVSVNAPADSRLKVREKLAGNDYGLSLFRTDNGETIAVLVDEESPAYEAGIRNGTVITEWDGVPVDEAAAEMECIYQGYCMKFPVRENEDVYRPFFLAVHGGDSVNVTFIDEKGSKAEAELASQGTGRLRLSAAISSLQHNYISDANFSTKMISDTCGYLFIRNEEYRMLPAYIAYLRGGYHPALTKELDEKFRELKSQDMKSLVIDLRNNSGGLNVIGGAVASMFTDEKHFQFGMGVRENGTYRMTEEYHIFPDGRWKDIPVAVLVNQSCMSAGDGTAFFLSKCDNVSLMGITPSNGVNQSVGGKCYLPGGFAVSYPVFLSLGEDGKPLIDTDPGRTNRIPLDVVIPVDKEAALRIFSNDEEDDYELEYAVSYLAEKCDRDNGLQD